MQLKDASNLKPFVTKVERIETEHKPFKIVEKCFFFPLKGFFLSQDI